MDHYRGEFITAGLITDSQDDKNRFYGVWLTTSRNWKSGKVRSPGAYFRKAIATGEIYITQSIDDEAAQLIKGKSIPQRIRTSDNRDPSSGGGTRICGRFLGKELHSLQSWGQTGDNFGQREVLMSHPPTFQRGWKSDPDPPSPPWSPTYIATEGRASKIRNGTPI